MHLVLLYHLPWLFFKKKLRGLLMKDEMIEMILKAHQRSFQRAFETAVRTNTVLVFARNGKVVEVKPPYRYELVPIKTAKKKKSKAQSRKK